MVSETLPRFRVAGNDSPVWVNIILFEAAELTRPLPRTDPRAVHLLRVLRRGTGDSFDAGIINGARGKATLLTVAEDSLSFSFAEQSATHPPGPITLLIGLPRPQTARDILRDATTLGVSALHFVCTEKSEPSYVQSRLWSSGEWRRHLIAGAEQAFDTRLPEVTTGRTLAEALAALTTGTRIALDNYEAPSALSECQVPRDREMVLAIGGERGWSHAERHRLREQGFHFHHLGDRILRTETACTAALSIMRAKLGFM
jgi:RsmE family RNA methyltransferase